MKRKKNKKVVFNPPAKPYLQLSGVFERADRKPMNWKDVERLLAAMDKAGFCYGGGLHLQTEEEAESDASLTGKPTVWATDENGKSVHVAVTKWQFRTG